MLIYDRNWVGLLTELGSVWVLDKLAKYWINWVALNWGLFSAHFSGFHIPDGWRTPASYRRIVVSLAYQAQKSIEFVWLNSKIELKTEITLDDLARAHSPSLSLSLSLCNYLCCRASASTSASQVSMEYITQQTYLYLISLRSCEWGKTKLGFLSFYFLSSSVLWSVILSLLLVFMTLRNAFQATDATRENSERKCWRIFQYLTPSLPFSLSFCIYLFLWRLVNLAGDPNTNAFHPDGCEHYFLWIFM